MKKYRVTIYWSDEDRVYIAEVPELPGCMTHGETQAIALANANEAIQAWIDTANVFGDSIPKPREKRVTSNSFAEDKYRPTTDERKLQLRRNNPRNFLYARASRTTVNPKAL